jgi:uracil-DNA glycosylase
MAGKSAHESVPIIIERLKHKYPDARYELNWETPVQLLVATILAAQSTDERINRVTPGLFAKYPDARAFAGADRAELEQDLKPTGFYRNKAKAVQECCRALVERFGGEVPPRIDDLVTLPGVARKTANVVLNNAFRIPSGVIVDTHVARVSRRMGLTGQTKPEKIEQDLMGLVPKDEWVQFGPAMVLHGRYTCTHHNPSCAECLFNDLCPKIGVEAPAAKAPEGRRHKAAGGAERSTAPAAALPALAGRLPADWRAVLAEELAKPYFRRLAEFVAGERREHTVFPPEEDVFNAFTLTPYEKVKVLLLGQDPYHDDGQAHGLCFSVHPGVRPPPSLVNVFKELHDDLGCRIPNNGHLTPWAKQGVMLMNAVLTVQAHEPASHKERGWETFTDAVIRALSAREAPVVFLLWGAYAQKKKELIDGRHVVLTSAHPSPLSARKFFGSKPFSQANQALEKLGQAPIDWQLPDLAAGSAAEPSIAPPPPADADGATGSDREPRELEEPAASAEVPPAPAAPAFAHLRALSQAAELPEGWLAALAGEFAKPYFRKLDRFLDDERQAGTVLPGDEEVFRALRLTPPVQVKVVLVGDEPSAKKGQSYGLAYSVPPGVAPTPALRNIFHELRADLGCWIPRTGCLEAWARQGVLLLNSVLTVRAGQPESHKERGWETFTDAVVRSLSAREAPIVFLLCGAAARKEPLIDPGRHVVLTAPDPSGRGFRGSRPFSAVNSALERRRQRGIYWQLYTL